MSELDRLRWDAHYRELPAEWDERGPDPFLAAATFGLTQPGRVLDVAGGDGRNAVGLARRGWAVTVADRSGEALRRAAIRAQSAGVGVTTQQVDLELESFPSGP